MKALFTIVLVLTSLVACRAQTNKTDSCFSKLDTLTGKKVYIAGKMPELESGENLIREFMKRIKSPNRSVDSKVIVAFVIDEQGNVSGKRIIRGKELGQQVLAILDDLKWKPAMCGGEKVAALYMFTIVIDFKE